MAFKASERLPLWQEIETRAKARLASVDTDYPAADEGLRARIRAGAQSDVETASGFVKFYSE